MNVVAEEKVSVFRFQLIWVYFLTPDTRHLKPETSSTSEWVEIAKTLKVDDVCPCAEPA